MGLLVCKIQKETCDELEPERGLEFAMAPDPAK